MAPLFSSIRPRVRVRGFLSAIALLLAAGAAPAAEPAAPEGEEPAEAGETASPEDGAPADIAPAPQSPLAGAVVARVNGAEITRVEFDQMLLDEFGRGPVDDLVREMVIGRAAAEARIEIGSAEAKAWVVEFKEGVRPLEGRGITLEDLLGALAHDPAGLEKAAGLWLQLEKLARKKFERPVSAEVAGHVPPVTFIHVFQLQGARFLQIEDPDNDVMKTYEGLRREAGFSWEKEEAAATPILFGKPMSYEEISNRLWAGAGREGIRETLEFRIDAILLMDRLNAHAVKIGWPDAALWMDRNWEWVQATYVEFRFVEGEFREKTREMLARRIMGKSEATRRIVIDKILQKETTEEALQAFHEKNKARYARTEVHARHIFLEAVNPKTQKPRTPAAFDEARENIEEIAKEVKGGASFEEKAREYSDDESTREKGGDLGLFGPKGPENPRARDPDLLARVFALKAGEVSGPIRSSRGFHLVQVLEVKNGGEGSFKESREAVLADYIEERAPDFVKKLRADAKVEVLLP